MGTWKFRIKISFRSKPCSDALLGCSPESKEPAGGSAAAGIGWAAGARLRKNRAAADCLERRGDAAEPDRSAEWRAGGGEGRLPAASARLDSVGDGRGREGGSAGGSGRES